MKKKTLALICFLIFILGLGGGAAYLRFSPTGALNPASPDRAMEAMMGEAAMDVWQSAVRDFWLPEVGVFESADAVRDAALAALDAGPLTFERGDGFSAGDPVYNIYSAGRRLCVYRYAPQGGELLDGPELSSRSLTVALPRGAALTVNGVTAGEEYLSGSAEYDDLTALEQAYSAPPQWQLYTIDGLYAPAVINAAREGRPLTAAETSKADAAFTDSVSLTVLAPRGAEVTIEGAAASPSGIGSPAGVLDIPQGFSAGEFDKYEYAALKDMPGDISASLNGQALERADSGGAVLFLPASDSSLESAQWDNVRAFLEKALKYGAGQGSASDVYYYILPDSSLYQYYSRSTSAMFWVKNEALDIKSLTAGDFVPLGEDCFLCSAQAECVTETYYEKRSLSLDYELLLVKSGDRWLVADLSCDLTATEKLS